VELVARYLALAGNWTDVVRLDRSPSAFGDPLYAVIGRSAGAPEARAISGRARCP